MEPRLSGGTRPCGATGTRANWLDQDCMQGQNYMVGPAPCKVPGPTGGYGTMQWDLDLAQDQDHMEDQTEWWD